MLKTSNYYIELIIIALFVITITQKDGDLKME